MHFVDAKGILTGSGGHYGMNIYRGCTPAAFIVTVEAGVTSLLILLKTLRSSRMHQTFWKRH